MKIKILFITLLISAFAQGQVTIASDGLNNATTLFTLTNGTYSTLNSASGDRPATSPFAVEGSHSWGITNGTGTLLSNDINTSSYTSISATFRLASFSIGSTGNGADGPDIVTVEVSPDGGTSWYSTVRVLGNSNAYWAYSTGTGTASTAYDGNASPVDYAPAGGGNRTTDGYSTVTVTSLPAVTTLKFRITLFNNSANERWLVDDFKCQGTSACTPPADPVGSISVASTTCGTTTLHYGGADAANCYWQTASNGQVSTSIANVDYAISTGATYYVRRYDGVSCWSTNLVSYTATVANNPSVTTNPSNLSVVETNSASFSVVATNGLTYQWQEDTGSGGVNITNAGIYSGATSATLNISATTLAMNGYKYQCVVYANPCTPVASAQVTLTVTAAPTPCVIQGFGAGATAPSGWIFTGITGTYTSAGNYGVASPSVSLDTNNDAITTEVLSSGNGASQLSFWIKGQGINTGSTSTLQVDGYDGSTWTNIETISSATLIASSSAAVTKTYNSSSSPALPSGMIRFRFIYKKDFGNLGLDDVSVYCTTIAVNPPVVSASSEIGIVSSAYSYYISATNFPTSYTITSGSLPPGLTFNTTTGQISGAPTTIGSYSIDVTATNSGGTSVAATISFTIGAYVAGCYNVDFEDGIAKAAYVADNITLNGKSWNLSEALIGGTNTASDYGTGNLCIRMRSNYDAAATMIQDNPYGISTISFSYKKYLTGSYTNQLFSVDYSKDAGNTWINVGTIAPSTTTTNTFTSAVINQSGPIRVRIAYLSGTEDNNVRLNIDNLSVCDYTNTKEIEVFGNATTIANNSVTVVESNNTYFSSGYFVGIDSPIVKTFVITNNGTGTLNLSGLSLSSTTYYTITSGLSSSTLTAGQSATFSITFSSLVTGVKSATVTILSDDSDEATFNFLISTNVYNYTKCTLLPLSYIAQQDFDSNVAYTYTADASNANTVVAGGTNYGDNRATKTSMFVGTNSFQSKSQLNTITFASIDSQNYQNVELSFNLGAFAVTAGEGMETSDYVLVSTSIDGGVTYYPQLKITGNSNSIFDINNTLSTNTATYKANSTNPTRIGTLTSSTNTTAGTFKISKLPSVANLKIAITFLSNSSNEVWSIDNIAVKGQLPLSTTWTTAWSPSAPTSSTKAIINGSYDTSINGGSIQACECQINSTFTVNVTTGNYLEVQSNLTNSGILNVANNASLVQVNDDAVNTNTGTTSITRTTSQFEKYDYTYWSSPVENATISSTFSAWRTDYSFNFATANFSDLRIINSTVGDVAGSDSFDDYAPWAWQAYTGAMAKGQGYAIMGPTNITFSPSATVNVTFTGKQNNGLIPVTLALSGNGADANDDYNLIGNPYPSSIFADTFINLNPNISGTLYFWTHVGNISTANLGPDPYNFITDDYAVYNLTGGTRASYTGSSIPSGYIGSGQGFFVEAVNAADINFNNSMRSRTYSNANFYRQLSSQNTQSEGGDNPEKSRIWLNLQNPEGMFSQQLIGYAANTTLGFDQRYDGMVNVSKNYVSFYSFINQDKYRIQARSDFNENDVVPLGFFTATTGTYSISIDSVDGVFQTQNIYLQDNLLNIIHDLKQAPYSFTSNYGTYDNRFVLRYTNESLSNDDFDALDHNVVVSTRNGEMTINSYIENLDEVTVYDILGRQLLQAKNIANNVFVTSNITTSQQALLVKIKLANGTIVTRKIIL
jgi:hypothetical protein